jgi:hypothetical protein
MGLVVNVANQIGNAEPFRLARAGDPDVVRTKC